MEPGRADTRLASASSHGGEELSLEEAGVRMIEELRPSLRAQGKADEYLAVLRNHVFPTLGEKGLGEIRRRNALDVLFPIWHVIPVQVRVARKLIHRIYLWAMAYEYVESSPAGEALDGALPKRRGAVKHHASMPYGELPSAMPVLAGSGGYGLSLKACLSWAILTGSRSVEARSARWEDIDYEARLWTIPGHMMKMGREHRVPLSESAMNILDVMGGRDGSGLVFKSVRGDALAISGSSLWRIVHRRFPGYTVHGFRSTFREWTMETGVSWDVAEACLAHAVGNRVAQAYARSDILGTRWDVMRDWAEFTGFKVNMLGKG